jgi:hypothetical protein
MSGKRMAAQNGTNIANTTSDFTISGGANQPQLLEQQWIVNAAAVTLFSAMVIITAAGVFFLANTGQSIEVAQEHCYKSYQIDRKLHHYEAKNGVLTKIDPDGNEEVRKVLDPEED